LVLLCLDRPPEAPSFASIRIEARKRLDGQWALIVRLERGELKGLFNHLLDDLVAATRGTTQETALVFVARLARWQRLLARAPTGLLDDDVLRGLAAELHFLLHEAVPVVGLRPAVEGWVGPWEAPKDFVFPRAQIEVKSVHQTMRRVTISSLEQLTDAGAPLFLWTCPVELETVAVPPAAGSMAHLVARVRAVVADDSSASAHFEEGLRAVGWTDRDEYRLRVAHFGDALCHSVRAGFPRIERGMVHPAVTEARYRLDLDQLTPWAVDTWTSEGLR
jgi:hypothetical protein